MKLIDKLTIGMFQQIRSLPEDMNEATRGARIISIFENTPIEDVRKWPLKKYKDTLAMYTTIDFSKYESKRAKTIEVSGETLKVITDPSKLTAGQLIDMIETMKSSDNPIMYMNRALAIICRKGKKYDSQGLQDRAQAMKDVLLKDTWGVWVFFFNLWIHYCSVSEDFLSDKMKTTLTEAKTILSSPNGVGS